ncbi:MAG: hypothetical protein WCF04_09170 [Candidatus Nanopelagicales bacterium]
MQPNALLREIFDIPEVVAASDFVLQLHAGVDHAAQTVSDYVATASLAAAFDHALGFVGAAVAGGKAQGVFLHGSFGSGKSHFMAVLDLMLRGEPSARAIPGLQPVVARHADVLARNLLTVEYHLIGAASLEQSLFSGFTRRIAAVHPDVPAPMLHKSDRLFADAAGMRAANEADFFARLNAGTTSAGGWGDYASGWTPDSYDRAAAAGPGDADRARLAADLVRTMFTGYAAAGEWLDIADGLAVMTRTARDLGYEGLVLFLDELVLWLASHASDAAFVSSEASKVAKLVESGVGERAVPMVSFVARQRELSDFIGDKATGVQRAQVGQTIQYWEDRFDTITLSAANLPEVAHKRLLTPTSPAAAAQVASAVAAVKASASWNVLLDDEAGSGEDAFAKVYPFSPALVDVLVALSGRLQRERTALKVMAHLLSARRDTAHVNEVIGVGELYDVMIGSGEQPLSEEMRQLFAIARTLYDTKFAPLLLAAHGVAPAGAVPLGHQLNKDARLAKTLLVAALVPEVKSVSRLTAGRLAALNHGTVQAWIPGEEATQVLATVRSWAQQVGELHIGEGADPVISVELSGVDYDSVLARVEVEDTPGARRQLLRRLLFAELGIREPGQLTFAGLSVDRVWRGTRRTVDVLFGNIRDSATMPDAALVADGERWKLVIDYPFDEGDHGPQEDVNRFNELRIARDPSRTVGWVPYFLTAARQADLGKLVQLEHVLGGTGAQFDANAAHLAVEQRALARQGLANLRRALTETIRATLRQAYGIAPIVAADIDRSGFGEVTQLPTLWRDEPLRRPAGATLATALDGIIDQMLTIQYPEHPKFDSPEVEVRPGDLRAIWEVIAKAAASQGGRLDPVEQNRRAVVRRLGSPLRLGYVGETHFVFDEVNFGWRNEFVSKAAAQGLTSGIPVSAIRSWLAPRGLTREMGNLIVAAFALLEDKQFQRHGAHVPVTEPAQVGDDLVLVDPRLPSAPDWERASRRAVELFGIVAGQRVTAANAGALARQLGEAASARLGPCRELVAQLERHAATLGITADSPRLATARAGMALVEGLVAATDDVARVEALAAMFVPAEPQPLAKSMSSAADVVEALRRHDWTTLDAVARAARGGDSTAAAALAGVRQAGFAEELHASLQAQLAAAHASATQWLVRQREVVSEPAHRPEPPQPPGQAPGQAPGTPVSSGPTPSLTNPDLVRLELMPEGLDGRLRQLADEIGAELKANPDKTKVVITWSLQ